MKLLSATIVLQDPGRPTSTRFLKYHNVQNTEPAINRFVKFAINKAAELKVVAKHINFYDQEGEKRYQFRRYCS